MSETKKKKEQFFYMLYFFTHIVSSGQRKCTHYKDCFKMVLALLWQHLVGPRNEQSLSHKTSARHTTKPETYATRFGRAT